MKHKLWLLQIPIVLLFTFALYVTEAGVGGNLKNNFLRTKLFPYLRVVTGSFSNAKFLFRGTHPPKNKIVIVEIDSEAIAQLGRWPWHRDVTAYLLEKIFQAGAKVVGLDMVFSEPDKRIPDELATLLTEKGFAQWVDKFETDRELQKTIATHKENLVLGWTTDYICQPAYAKTQEDCPVSDPELVKVIPAFFNKFSYQHFHSEKEFTPEKTPFLSAPTLIANMPFYGMAASHSGFFNAWPDNDGYIRRTNLVMFVNGKPYPSLPLEMARVILKDELEISIDQNERIKKLGFKHLNRQIPVSPLGTMEINFRGPANTFQYVRALEVMRDENEIHIEKLEKAGNRIIASVMKSDILKDAYVFVGLSALGVFDMRAFPFDSNVPGVEGHANILDNLIAGDALVQSRGNAGVLWIFLLMVIGALFFAYYAERIESVPALLLFVGIMSGVIFLDFKYLFSNNINWNTGFFYLEMGCVFIFTLAVKYVVEEKNKKFIRGAFSKYVAPAIVDSILKDPSKLSVGGVKKDLTILFSDIRGFTTISERMDAKSLAGFLNDYLGQMTDIVFNCEGTLDKYIGDAVMAFWGAPIDHPKHASNSCHAAIKMMSALATMKPRFKEKYGVDIDIGIGINSGAVNVGNMGSERIFEYTVIGDHVNLASRLEGLTKAYGASIVTSRFTFDHIQLAGEPLPSHRILDFVKVKGKKNAVELIQLLEGDPPLEGLKLFAEGRGLYLQKRWDAAILKFQAANETLRAATQQEDGPSKTYLERCIDFKNSPPSPDWDGSWEMHSK